MFQIDLHLELGHLSQWYRTIYDFSKKMNFVFGAVDYDIGGTLLVIAMSQKFSLHSIYNFIGHSSEFFIKPLSLYMFYWLYSKKKGLHLFINVTYHHLSRFTTQYLYKSKAP